MFRNIVPVLVFQQQLLGCVPLPALQIPQTVGDAVMAFQHWGCAGVKVCSSTAGEQCLYTVQPYALAWIHQGIHIPGVFLPLFGDVLNHVAEERSPSSSVCIKILPSLHQKDSSPSRSEWCGLKQFSVTLYCLLHNYCFNIWWKSCVGYFKKKVNVSMGVMLGLRLVTGCFRRGTSQYEWVLSCVAFY